jgi:hypothetical protein
MTEEGFGRKYLRSDRDTVKLQVAVSHNSGSSKFHTATPFVETGYVSSYSGISPHFMQPQCSLKYSEESPSEPRKLSSSPSRNLFLQGLFYYAPLSTPRISKWSLTFRSNELTSWSWALLEKPPVAQLLKNFPAFYGTRKFITVFTRALHLSLS